MSRNLRWLLGGFVILAVGGVVTLIWYHWPQQQRFYTDGATIREPLRMAAPRDILWQPPVPLSAVLNTAEQDYEPRLSWDGLTLYYVRGQAGKNADIYFAKRKPAGWTEPAPLAALNTHYDELGPEPSPDGEAIYFYSDRPGGQGGYDLWVARRGLEEWQAPINLGPAVNSEFNDYGPALSPDGDSLYFASNRPPGVVNAERDPGKWSATVREDLFGRPYDLYVATLTDAGPTQTRALAMLNTPVNEGAPCVSPAGDFVYFASDRPGGHGGFDLFRARRLDGAHLEPINLGPSVNTAANELDPGLTDLGYALYFSSDRPVAQAEPRMPADYNLYYTAAREVFADMETWRRPPIDWAALLSQNWWYLLWLLLLPLILMLLRALLGDLRDKRMGLLTRCLLASLLAHCLAMMLLSFWNVRAALADTTRRGGQLRISLATPGDADELARQILGTVTQVEMPEIARVRVAQIEAVVRPVTEHTLAEMAVDRADIVPREVSHVRPDATDAPAVTHAEIKEAHPVEAAATPEFALPTESQRIDARETQERMTPAVADVRPPRPEHVPVTDQRFTGAVLNPARNADAVQRTAARPLEDFARQSDVRDAGQPAAAADSTPTEIAIEETQTLALTLPHAPEGAVQEEARETALAPVPADGPIHPNVAQPIEIDAGETQLVSFIEAVPSATELEPRRQSAFETDVHDAPPVQAALPTREAQSAQAIATPPIALELPTLDTATMQHREEPATTPAATAGVTAQARADVPPDVNPTQSRPALAQLAPDAVQTAATELPPRRTWPVEDVETKTAASERMTEPAAVVAPDESPALELQLPSEIEPEAPAAASGVDVLDDGPLPPNVIHGIVTDAETEQPLAGAAVHLDVHDAEPVVATTDDAGRFSLTVPAAPDHIALSASHDGYVPATANVPAGELPRGGLRQDFALQPETETVLALEQEPEVHHLGNDRWEGRINSQFQKRAEGRILRAYFTLSASHVSSQVATVELRFMAKGVQCPHRVGVNGEQLDERLHESPNDGSFGPYAIEIAQHLLVAGGNVLEIQSTSCRGDLDDFELVNLQLHFMRE